MQKTIAFGHQQQVGKSTLAGFLVTVLRIRYPGRKIKQVAFADGVKDTSHKLYGYLGLHPANYYEQNYKAKDIKLPCGFSPRDIWIWVGDRAREIDDKVWINNTLDIDCDILIVIDLRYMAEADAIEEKDGCNIKINRDVPRGTNPAEVDLLDFDRWCKSVDNYGTLKDLYHQAELLADYLL